jgi:biotin synthase
MKSLMESPEFVRCSMAAAMTLGLKPGRFWRNARLHCINLLLTYEDGCLGACAYCGLSRARKHDSDPGQDARPPRSSESSLQAEEGSRLKPVLRTKGRTFIRVQWPTYPLREILDRLPSCHHARRVCISMVTHRRALEDTIAIAEAIRRETAKEKQSGLRRAQSSRGGPPHCQESEQEKQSGVEPPHSKERWIPISALVTPTLVDAGGLERLRGAGVDKIGIAMDAATPRLFDQLRGASAGGPHRWETYWERFAEAVEIFGGGNVGSHFIVGLGETERDLAGAFQTVHDLGGLNQLFSFFPEPGSKMERVEPPPMDSYRRVQLAAHLIDSGIASASDFTFDSETGRILSFGIPEPELQRLIATGEPFMTRGCSGPDGRVACNRPFANSLPGPGLRNYPFPPDAEDLERIRLQLAGQWTEEKPRRRRSPHHRAMTFFAPSIKHFDTDEFKSSGQPVYVAASVTGKDCDLRCLHCDGGLLRNTYPAETPQALWDLTARLNERGLRGLLLTGGCDSDGIVPLAPFCPTLARLKSELGLRTTLHSKLINRPLAEALRESRADAVLLDVVGSLDMLQRIYRLTDKTLDDIRHGLDLLGEYDLPISPHVVLSNLAGADGEGYRALALVEGRRLHSLVIVLLMALPGCEVGPTTDWDLGELRRLFENARAMFPGTPLTLGCARPLGPLQKQVDALAVETGFDGIAFPSEGTVARARELGRDIRFSEFCCSLMI